MSALVWRQYRSQAAAAGVLLAAFAALLVVTGMQVAAQWHSALSACTASGTCGHLSGSLFLGNHEVGFLVILTLLVPPVLGILCGAPLVAHELESRTSEFAWTQAITRRRWLAVKAGWLLLAAACVAGVVSGLVTWWSGPDNALQADAFSFGRFDIMGIVPVAYALFAMALGIACGTVLRKTIPAIGLTLAGYLAVRLLFDQWVRPHYLSAVTHVYGLTQNFVPAGAAWLLGSGVVTPGGGKLAMQDGSDISANVPSAAVPRACMSVASQGQNNPGHALSCMQSLGYRQFVTYQPAGRYWEFQGIEALIFVALAAGLLAVAFAVVARRDA
jgi:hypothetical protein